MHTTNTYPEKGFSLKLYLRHQLFGSIFVVAGIYFVSQLPQSERLPEYIYLFLIMLLYPLSLYVIDCVIGYIAGNSTYIFSIRIFVLLRLFVMLIAFSMSFILGPLCLIYLYYKARKYSPVKAE